MYASIVVDVKSSNTDVIYTYHIPSHLESFVYVGSRVIVPYAVRQITGYVVEIIDECEYQGVIKDIVEVLDYDKELTEEQVLLAKTIATETKSLLTSCLGLMYPSFLKAKYRKYVTVKNFADLDANVAMLFNAKGKIAINDKLLQEYPKIKTEIKKGNLELSYDVYSYGKRKYTKLYFYDEKYDVLLKDYKGSELKKRIIKFVKEAIKGCTIDKIKEHINCSNYVVRSIEKDGYIFSKNVLFNEKPAQAKPQKLLKYINYNFDQASLKEKYDTLSSKPFLLFSNDEKFKLDFYLSIATELVNNNKKVLILTPTLITNFLVALHFKKYLSGYRIVTFSSDLSQAEYYDNYMEVKWNDYDIIITTKVGAFLPLNDLGLIIVVDEENNNYIGEYSPKYHAIEVMKNRAKYHNAKLVLSTSSPSMEAYYNYSRAKYSLLKYIVPNNNDVEIVDMHSQFYDENLIISKELQNRITNTLSNDNQVMLILNAKGYSTYLTCRNCGKILKCPKCKITMTYYQEKNETKCRYCGTKAESLYCDCGNNYTMLGIGLEKVKETIQNLYPNKNVLLLDSDSLADYDDFQDAMVKIETNEASIILGTNNIISMYSPNIKLIGMLAIDTILNANDYRASESVYQLISNAINKDCHVLLQAYNTDHYAITTAINNNYSSFYNTEIASREMFQYPPYLEINRIIVTGDYKEMYHCANYFRKVFRTIFTTSADVLGPTYNTIKKGAQLLIKHNDYPKLSKLIDEVEKKFADKKINIQFERHIRNLHWGDYY